MCHVTEIFKTKLDSRPNLITDTHCDSDTESMKNEKSGMVDQDITSEKSYLPSASDMMIIIQAQIGYFTWQV